MTSTTKTTGKVTMKNLVVMVMDQPEGLREEYLYYYLRQIFPGSSEAAIEVWASKVKGWIKGI